MPWPSETEAQDKLVEALFVTEEIYGTRKTIDMLEQELRRLKVINDLREHRQKLLPAPQQPAVVTESPAAIEAAVQALKFYGEESFYERPRTGRDRRCEIEKDEGFKAREALAMLAGDEDEEDA
jgi:hypothetical protein